MTTLAQQIEQARPFLEAALDYCRGSHKFSDIVEALDTGQMQLWVTDRAAVVTEIYQQPQAKTCHIFLAGGDLEELARMQPVVEGWARSLGCTRMTLAGRRGWERTFLRETGYEPAWSVMVKVI